MEINAALHWPIGRPGIYNKMFKYATSHLRHPTRRILAFFENVSKTMGPLSRTRPHLFTRPVFLITVRFYLPRVCVCCESFSKRSPRVKLLNGERRSTPFAREIESFASRYISAIDGAKESRWRSILFSNSSRNVNCKRKFVDVFLILIDRGETRFEYTRDFTRFGRRDV